MQTGRVIDAKSGTVKPPVTLRFGPVALRFGNARLAGATAKHDKMPVAFTDSPAYTAPQPAGAFNRPCFQVVLKAVASGEG